MLGMRHRFLGPGVIAAALALMFVSAGSSVQAQRDIEGRPWLNEGVEDRSPTGGGSPPPRGEYGDYPERRMPTASGAEMGWQGNVLFDFNSARLRSEHKSLLDSIARTMRSNPDVDLLITGHADHIGNLDYNRRLAQRRARAVEQYLMTRGIDPQRIVTRTVGEQRPVASSETEEDRSRNRRADLAFFPAGNEPPPAGELVIGDTEPGRGPPPGPSYKGLP